MPKLTLLAPTRATLRKRMQRAKAPVQVKNGPRKQLRTKRIVFEERKDRDTCRRRLKVVCQKIINKYLEDNLKAPNSNGPKSAYLSKPSTDVYFGTNKEAAAVDRPLRRYAYALGSGGGSIGLDQRHLSFMN